MNTAKNNVTPLPPVRLRYTEMELCGCGFILLDRDPIHERLSKKDREELARLSARAHWAAERGLVHLLQRRHGECDYSYLIVARPRPKAVSATILATLEQEAA
jgi:hypothetical protein